MNTVILDALASQKLRDIYKVWSDVAKDRVGPARSEISPALLKSATSIAFFVEIIAGGQDFRFGFAGDKLLQFLEERCATPTLAGLRGVDFFDRAEDLFRRCITTQKPLISGPKQTHYRGKQYLERQVLLLPLSEDGVTITGLLGALDTWQLGTNVHRNEPLLAD